MKVILKSRVSRGWSHSSDVRNKSSYSFAAWSSVKSFLAAHATTNFDESTNRITMTTQLSSISSCLEFTFAIPVFTSPGIWKTCVLWVKIQHWNNTAQYTYIHQCKDDQYEDKWHLIYFKKKLWSSDCRHAISCVLFHQPTFATKANPCEWKNWSWPMTWTTSLTNNPWQWRQIQRPNIKRSKARTLIAKCTDK